MNIAAVRAQRPFKRKSASLGNAAAAQITLIAANLDPLELQLLHENLRQSIDGFAHQAASVVARAQPISDLSLGNIPIELERPMLPT